MDSKEDKTITEISKDTWSQMYLEELRYIFTAEASAIRAAMVINAGASIALLGFMANIISKPNKYDITEFAFSMLVYVASVLSAAVCYWLSAWSQRNYSAYKYNPKLVLRKKLSSIINDISVFLIWLSYTGFGYGGWLAYKALLSINNNQ